MGSAHLGSILWARWTRSARRASALAPDLLCGPAAGLDDGGRATQSTWPLGGTGATLDTGLATASATWNATPWRPSCHRNPNHPAASPFSNYGRGWLAVGRRVERDAPISLPTLAAVRGSARRETAAPKPTASPVRGHRSKAEGPDRLSVRQEAHTGRPWRTI